MQYKVALMRQDAGKNLISKEMKDALFGRVGDGADADDLIAEIHREVGNSEIGQVKLLRRLAADR